MTAVTTFDCMQLLSLVFGAVTVIGGVLGSSAMCCLNKQDSDADETLFVVGSFIATISGILTSTIAGSFVIGV